MIKATASKSGKYEEMEMTIGQSIKLARESRGIKQIELAQMIGTNQVTVSLWETDRVYPRLIMFICVADALNISLDELVGRTPREIHGG